MLKEMSDDYNFCSPHGFAYRMIKENRGVLLLTGIIKQSGINWPECKNAAQYKPLDECGLSKEIWMSTDLSHG